MPDVSSKAATIREAATAEHVAPRPARRRSDAQIVPAVQAPSQERIAQRAYELFVQRGGNHGDDLSDWFQAEAELLAESAVSTTIES